MEAELFPCSAGQRGLWHLAQGAAPDDAYHLSGGLWLHAAPPLAHLDAALNLLVERHEALRTAIIEEEGQPFQAIWPAATVAVEALRLPRAPAGERAELAQALAETWARRPFDLRVAPLLRAALLTGADRPLLLLSLHHAIADGWSLRRLVGELAMALERLSRGAPPSLPPVELQLLDLAQWQEAQLARPEAQARLAARAAALSDSKATALPRVGLRPPHFDPRCARHDRRLEGGAALEALARAAGQTPFAGWLTLLFALLGHTCQETDLCLGLPLANRATPRAAAVVGHFANLGVLRCHLQPGEPFAGLLRRVGAGLQGLRADEDLPFDRLVEAINPPRDPSRHPLVQLVFAMPDPAFGEGSLSLGGLVAEVAELAPASTKFDLTIELEPRDGAHRLRIEHATALISTEEAATFADRWARLLGAVIADPPQALDAIDLRAPAERHAQAAAESGPTLPPRGPGLLPALLGALAEAPEAIALEEGDLRLSRAAALNLSAHLAHQLGAARPDERIGVLAPRGLALILAELAIWRAGGGFVPLDPALPAARLAAMAEDAGLRRLFVAPGLEDKAPPGCLALPLRLDLSDAGAPPAVEAPTQRDAAALAYAIFTSGSTGRPKGVALSRGALLDRLRGRQALVPCHPGDRLAQLVSAAFDPHPWEVWYALLGGATVVCAPEAVATDPAALRDWLLQAGITLAFATTPLAEGLLGLPWPTQAPLRDLLTGGDRLRRRPPPGLPFRLWNFYGPTEVCIVATGAGVAPEGEGLPSIGRPYPGVTVSVVDPALQPTLPGAPGELLIGGAGLAWGYLGRPGETAARFVPDPQGPPGARAYRSGDLGLWQADGELAFAGRIDRQLKLRGLRIEPAEIERLLEAQPSVAEALVFLDEAPGSAPRLIACVVPRPGAEFAAEPLSAALSARLPAWMVPAAWVCLDQIPLTPNGKPDRARLPRPPRPEAPVQGPLELQIAEAWQAALGGPLPQRTDDFFALGGHSLLVHGVATALSARLGRPIGARLLLQHPRLVDLAQAIGLPEAEAPAAPLQGQARVEGPATAGQRQLWWEQQRLGDGAAYHMAEAVWLDGPLDAPRLRAALAALFARHPALRTRLVEAGGGLRQVIDPPPPDPLLEVALAEEAVAAWVEAEVARPFDLGRGPPARVRLLRVGPTRHALVWVLHHALGDGWSVALISEDLRRLYAGEALPPLPLNLIDLALAEAAAAQRGDWAPAVERWRGPLTALPTLNLPAEPGEASAPCAAAPLHLPGPLWSRVLAFARAQATTPFTVLLSAFVALLHRFCEQDDLCLGVPFAGRDRPETEGLVGYLVNTLPIRLRLEAPTAFGALLATVHAAVTQARQDQGLPLLHLIEALAPARPQGQHGLYDVMFAFQRGPTPKLALPGITSRPMDLGDTAPFVSLSLDLAEVDGACAGALVADPARLGTPALERLAGLYLRLLDGALADPAAPIAAHLRARPEDAALLDAWGHGPPLPRPATDTLHGPIWAAAARHPEAPALRWGEGQRLSYGALIAAAEGVAAALHAAGARVGDRVGLRLPRGPGLITGMLGVLRAGCAMVPTDESAPASWCAQTLEDAGARFLLEEEHPSVALPGLPGLVRLTLAPGPGVAPTPLLESTDAAYLLFTSGSSGRPKGAIVSHGNAAAFVAATCAQWDLGPTDRLMQFASPSFDAAIEEIFPILSVGGTLLLRMADLPEVSALCARAEAEGCTILDLPTSLFHQWMKMGAGFPAPIRLVVIGGEAVRIEAVRAFPSRPGLALLNTYGPTETTVVATAARLDPTRPEAPIGRPLAGVHVHLVDEALLEVAPGMPGELLIGGLGVSQGYTDQPTGSAARFLPDPWSDRPGARLFRSGDLARWGADGALRFLGRRDAQVKVRGFRVELPALEAALAALPGVADAAADLREQQLMAWVSPAAGASLEPLALLATLQTQVPAYMVPARLQVVASLPRSLAGKVDRRSLITPPPLRPTTRGPRSPLVELVAQAWAAVLGVEAVDPEVPFQEFGGHSLAAAAVISRIEQLCAIRLSFQEVFAHPTPAALARRLALGGPAARPPLAPRPPGPLPLSDAQRRMLVLAALAPDDPSYLLPCALRLQGPLQPALLEGALAGVLGRHDILRTRYRPSPTGPQAFLGAPAPLRRLTVPPGSAWPAALWAPLDLFTEGPLRAALLEEGPDSHVLVLVAHHIAVDGHSTQGLLTELVEAYEDLRAGRPLAPPPLLQLADYNASVALADRSEERAQERRWWADQLRGAPTLGLPGAPEGAWKGVSRRGPLPLAAVEPLLRVARAAQATPFMALLTAFLVGLGRQTQRWDLPVATPMSLRGEPALDAMMGNLINTVLIRVDLRDRPSFRVALERVRAAVLAAWAHRELPYNEVVEAAGAGPQGAPLASVMFLLEEPTAPPRWPGLALSLIELPTGGAKFDLTLAVTPGEALTVELRDQPGAAERADGWLQAIPALLAELAADPDAPVGPPPAGAVLRGPSAPQAAPLLLDALAARALAAPTAPALIADGQTLSVADLHRAAQARAAALWARGLRPGDRVGLCLPRCATLLIDLLAVLACRAAVVPIDPDLPAARRQMIADDAGVVFVLDEEGSTEALPCPPAPTAPPGPAELAYLLYTSGSTGRPKGVAVSHGALAGYLDWVRQEHLGDGPGLVPVLTSIGFDLTITALLAPLGAGQTVWMHRPTDLPALLTLFAEGPPWALLKLTPSHLRLLREAGLRPDARVVVVGGEALAADDLRAWAAARPAMRVVNEYGPTEAVVGCCSHRADPALPGAVPIGLPHRGVDLHLLDEAGDPVPEGALGELFIGGPGLAVGYWGRPAETALRFVPDPFGPPGARRYRTGDLVHRQPDGLLVYHGRQDDQIKLRGHRIEPAEIEATLLSHPGVSAAVVQKARTGRPRLLAWVRGDAVGALALARSRLPAWMVPDQIIALDALPLTHNGKVDRARLPEPAPAGARPATPTELRLSLAWEPILGPIDVSADLFADLGVKSLDLLALGAAATQSLGRALPLTALLRHPTVRALARALDEDQPATGDLITLRSEGAGPPIVCLPSSVGRAASYLALARALRQPVYAFEAPGLDGQEPPFTEAAALVRRYAEGLQTAIPAGPLILLGHSSGGPLAHALAELLEAQGRAVPLVVVIDTPAAADPSPLPEDAVLLDNHLHLLRLLLGETEASPVPDRRAAARRLWTQAGLPGDPQIDAALAVERGLLSARQAQTLGHISRDLLLIRAGADPAPDDWGWRPHVGGRLIVVALDGDHHTLMTPPRVDAVAALAAAHSALHKDESAHRV